MSARPPLHKDAGRGGPYKTLGIGCGPRIQQAQEGACVSVYILSAICAQRGGSAELEMSVALVREEQMKFIRKT